jgi:RNA-directed DNA polymerase
MALWRWVRRRHTRKGAPWLKKKYFRSQGLKDWIFSARTPNEGNEITYVDLFKASSVAIKRHTKIKAEATPFDPRFTKYFEERERKSARIDVKSKQPSVIKIGTK